MASRGTRATLAAPADPRRAPEPQCSGLNSYDGSVPADGADGLPAAQPPMLRVCSYNLLAQSLLEANWALYAQCAPDAVNRSARLTRIGHLLSHLNADVLALQEVERETFERLNERLGAQGMQGVYKKRTGNQQDGVALFVRSSRLNLLAAEEVEYRELAAAPIYGVIPSHIEDAALGARLQEMARKDNVALLLVVNDSLTGHNILVGCTHILWNPKRGLIKLAQIRELMRRAHTLSTDHNAGTILCGDFNCTPRSLLHSYLCGAPVLESLNSEMLWDGSLSVPKWHGRGFGDNDRGRARRPNKGPGHGNIKGRGGSDRSHNERPSRNRPFVHIDPHPFGTQLRSAFGHIGEPRVTTFHGGFRGTVDYIMFDSVKFSPRAHLRMPAMGDIRAERSLPSARRPSDHVPIACDMEMLSRDKTHQ